jgi:hypothetical protein
MPLHENYNRIKKLISIYLVYIYLVLSLFFVIIGAYLIIIISPYLYALSVENKLVLIFTSGLAFLTLAFALLSFFSGILTDNKLREISNMMFLEALSEFEYTRMWFINPPNKLSIEAFLWRSLTCIERIAEITMKHIKETSQHRLINYFCTSLENLFADLTWEKLQQNQQKNIIKMLLIIFKYQRDDRGNARLIDIIQNDIGKNPYESESCFTERIIEEYNLQNYEYM